MYFCTLFLLARVIEPKDGKQPLVVGTMDLVTKVKEWTGHRFEIDIRRKFKKKQKKKTMQSYCNDLWRSIAKQIFDLESVFFFSYQNQNDSSSSDTFFALTKKMHKPSQSSFSPLM